MATNGKKDKTKKKVPGFQFSPKAIQRLFMKEFPLSPFFASMSLRSPLLVGAFVRVHVTVSPLQLDSL